MTSTRFFSHPHLAGLLCGLTLAVVQFFSPDAVGTAQAAIPTVTLNAADQSFFNAKGGKIGLWTVAAPNALFDDFGGGALTGVSSAALDATTVPDEVADDGAEIVAGAAPDAEVDAQTDETAVIPDASTLVNRVFLPQINR